MSPADTPFVETNGVWQLRTLPGQQVAFNVSFDTIEGYRTAVYFIGSVEANRFTVERAREIAKALRSTGGDGPEFAEGLEQAATRADRLNAGWVIAGRPDKPLFELPGGQA